MKELLIGLVTGIALWEFVDECKGDAFEKGFEVGKLAGFEEATGTEGAKKIGPWIVAKDKKKRNDSE